MKFAVLFSGGKDSVQCVDWALENGHEPAVLVTVVSENPESYMYHVPNIQWTGLQAEAMEIPILIGRTEGVKEEELDDMKDLLEQASFNYGVGGVLSGAIYSNYQSSRIEEICRSLGLDSVSPLWRRRPRTMLYETVDRGYEILMSAVAADGLGPEWLGRVMDREIIGELCQLHETCYVCTGGEGGEFETFVTDAPFFKRKISVLDGEKEWDGMAGVYRIKSAALVEK